MTSALLWAVRCCSLNALRKSSSEGSGLTSLYVLMYHTLALSLSQVAARRVCFSSGMSASSIYSSTLNVQAVTVAMEVSFPSNLSGFETLIVSGIVDGRVSSGCLWSTFVSFCLWSTFVSFGLWSRNASTASVVMPRARNSLERGMLTLGRSGLSVDVEKKVKGCKDAKFNRTEDSIPRAKLWSYMREFIPIDRSSWRWRYNQFRLSIVLAEPIVSCVLAKGGCGFCIMLIV